MLEEGRKLKLMQIHREVDSLVCGSCVSVSKYSSNIEHKVDKLINKHKTKFSKVKTKKTRTTVKQLRKTFKKIPYKGIISIALALIMILAIIPYILPPIYGGFSSDVTITLEPENIKNNETMFINVTIPTYYNITNVSADMAGIETLNLSLIYNNTFIQLWQSIWVAHNITPDENTVKLYAVDTQNTSYTAETRWSIIYETEKPDEEVNETIEPEGLNLSLNTDKDAYLVNESVSIQGVITYNYSYINTTVELKITGPNIEFNTSINTTNGAYQYQFTVVDLGSYNITTQVDYINDSIQETIIIKVIQTPTNITPEEPVEPEEPIEPEEPEEPEQPQPPKLPDIKGKPFDEVKTPEDSFGIKSLKFVNMSYFWEFFNTFSSWTLDAWNNENNTWVNASEYLIIGKNRSLNNQYEKITLEFTAPQTTDYKLTYNINRPIKEYINNSENHEYQLIYNVGQNEEYSTYFNYSDIARIPNVIISHGIAKINGNNNFWFSAQRNNISQGSHIVLDPVFGNIYQGAQTKNGDEVPGGYFQIPSPGGTADNISAYLTTVGAPTSGRAAIFDSSNNLLTNGVTNELTSISGAGWFTFTYSTNPILPADEWYYLVFFGTSQRTDIYYNTTGGYGLYDDIGEIYPTFPDPYQANVVDNDALLSIYCSYTENQIPSFSNEYPGNQSTDIELTPVCNVTVSDSDDTTVDVYFYENATGTWVLRQQNLSEDVSSPANVIWNNYANANTVSKTYWWSVNVTDGKVWYNETYSFTTEPENTSISITPDNWNIGTINLGDNTYTSDLSFNLTNEGNVPIDIQVNATNATNSTTGLTWILNSAPGHKNYSLQYDKTGGGSWININSTFDPITQFVEGLAVGNKQGFDLKIFMATTTDRTDPLSVVITFKSVAS